MCEFSHSSIYDLYLIDAIESTESINDENIRSQDISYLLPRWRDMKKLKYCERMSDTIGLSNWVNSLFEHPDFSSMINYIQHLIAHPLEIGKRSINLYQRYIWDPWHPTASYTKYRLENRAKNIDLASLSFNDNYSFVQYISYTKHELIKNKIIAQAQQSYYSSYNSADSVYAYIEKFIRMIQSADPQIVFLSSVSLRSSDAIFSMDDLHMRELISYSFDSNKTTEKLDDMKLTINSHSPVNCNNVFLYTEELCITMFFCIIDNMNIRHLNYMIKHNAFTMTNMIEKICLNRNEPIFRSTSINSSTERYVSGIDIVLYGLRNRILKSNREARIIYDEMIKPRHKLHYKKRLIDLPTELLLMIEKYTIHPRYSLYCNVARHLQQSILNRLESSTAKIEHLIENINTIMSERLDKYIMDGLYNTQLHLKNERIFNEHLSCFFTAMKDNENLWTNV